MTKEELTQRFKDRMWDHWLKSMKDKEGNAYLKGLCWAMAEFNTIVKEGE